MKPSWLCLLLLLPLPAGAGSLQAEGLYHQSLEAYRKGQHQKALEGFMEVLLEDPSYPDARRYLSLAGQAVLDAEARRVAEESARIISDMEEMQGLRWVMDKRRHEQEAWRGLWLKALALAEDPHRLGLAVSAYETSLDAFPVYAAQRKTFQNASSEFRRRFLGRQWQPQGSVVVARDRAAQEELEKIKAREERLGEVLGASDLALREFKRRRFRESAELWKKVLREAPENPEARFYLERSLTRLGPVPGPARPNVPAAPLGKALAPGAAEFGKPSSAPSGLSRPAAKPSKPSEPLRPIAPMPARAPSVKPVKARPSPPTTAAQEGAEKPSAATTTPGLSAQEYYVKGLLAYAAGNLDEAVAHWRKCLEADPNHPKAGRALQRALREKR